ncbi:hypothetical protein [Castellaniella sp. S9]|uniref:hypothetical protein n=1 Tax=Castellaniella sp. S9 TaxID=2993652 RepID=UPI0022B4B886|nr:hypothetical protein [Castellaniella sp. S9]
MHPGASLATLAVILAVQTHAVAAADPAKQTPAYIELRRDVLINADLWTDQPRILAANYGFEGIIGIPGLQIGNLDLAKDAGAGVNWDWAELDPTPPLRNLTSAASVIGLAAAGFGAAPTYADAMPIEVSWPLLPSSVSPENIAITLNTGEVVTPVAAALNPNYDHNERHVIVVFGEFGNRLTPGTPGAIHPTSVAFVPGNSPLMAVGPDGPVSIVGLSAPSTNPYEAGPSLVGAKLSRFSPAGDFPPPALAGAFPNDAYSAFGEGAQYRLRLFTSGGFSPNGVSGFLPTDFQKFFRLHAVDGAGKDVVLEETGRVYDLGVGRVEILGLAELGAPGDDVQEPYYAEDHDNYFDIVLKGDLEAVRRLRAVEIPTSKGGYSDIYNPGGPGQDPSPGTTYTEPAPPQTFPIALSLDAPRTVSHAAQSLEQYDLDDDLPVVFRLRANGQPDRLTSSSRQAADLVGGGFVLQGVEFANEMARPGVSAVMSYVSDDGDRIYTLDASEQARLEADAGWRAEGLAFGAFARPWPGLSPVYRFRDRATGHHWFSPDIAVGGRRRAQVEYEGVAWYAALFVPADASGMGGGSGGGAAGPLWLAGLAALWWYRRRYAGRRAT